MLFRILTRSFPQRTSNALMPVLGGDIDGADFGGVGTQVVVSCLAPCDKTRNTILLQGYGDARVTCEERLSPTGSMLLNRQCIKMGLGDETGIGMLP